ncbi:sensor histidine kinase [Pontivivens nitratireducens]|uniref:sensor histidine kinase n=1 Tax=Pontivivens nitratireducens TaxID=2758038 RepID=UPI001639A35F|nr:sensor histidine kinase [Pontibrevibacter nitratireducens]
MVAAILSVAFFVIVRSVAEQAAESTQDDILSASATAIADSLRSEGSNVMLDLPYSALSMLGTLSEDRVFYRVFTGDGTLTGYDDLPLPDRTPQRGQPAFATFDYRGDQVRAVSVVRPVGTGTSARDIIVTVAQTRLGLEQTSRTITTTAMGVGAGFFLVATGLSLWAASAALAPIERLTGAVARRGPHDLRPVTADTPAELMPLVNALNSFMARLRASLLRNEDFIAEAAHRVRTPLATVRAQAEITHRKLNKPEHRRAMREMIRAIDESARSAGQMLDHAMVKFRTDTLAGDRLDMCALIGEVCDRLGATADLKDIQIVRDLPDEPIPARGDGILLQAALQNLLDNAIKYSPEDSRIVVRVEQGFDLKVSIQDEGRGFGDADLTRLKTRYTRGANVGDIVGSGLGLTIADEVTRAHGGRLEIVTNQTGVGACISLILPRI